MKYILTSIMLLFAITAFSQTDTTTLSTLNQLEISEAERIIDKYSSKAADTFISVLESAKPIAKETFSMVVRLQIAKGVGMMLPLVTALLFLGLFVGEYSRIEGILSKEDVPYHMNNRYGPFGEDNVTPKMIMYLVFGCLFSIISIFTVYDGILHFMAPEWFAIKEIMGLFK